MTRALEVLSLSIALVAGAAGPGCAGGALEGAAGAEGGEAGAPCGPDRPCRPDLVCVDGACAARVSPPEPAPEGTDVPDGVPPVDTWYLLPDAAAGDAGEAPPADGGPAGDAPADLAGGEVDGSGAPDVEEDAADPEDPDGDGASGDGDSAPGAETDIDAGAPGEPEVAIFLFGEDDEAEDPGSTLSVLDTGQGWATRIDVPFAGDLLGYQVVAKEAGVGLACGVYRPSLWLPAGDGSFAGLPDWQDPLLEGIEGLETAQVFLLSKPLPIEAGLVRFGLLLEGKCAGADGTPGLATDASGEEGSWIWAPGGGDPWIPAGAVGLEGRFALRILVETVWPPP